jgi:hypothetical protein
MNDAIMDEEDNKIEVLNEQKRKLEIQYRIGYKLALGLLNENFNRARTKGILEFLIF